MFSTLADNKGILFSLLKTTRRLLLPIIKSRLASLIKIPHLTKTDVRALLLLLTAQSK